MLKVYLFKEDGSSDCKSLEVELERIEGGLPYEVIKTSSSKGKLLSKQYGILAIPTLIKVNSEGEVKAALAGYRYTRDVFENFFEVPK
jgi:hypothetical protein|tara:strand:- start:6382 stop:6645 length:264 start_codon:yes stop_codon:yes gene_type:complete